MVFVEGASTPTIRYNIPELAENEAKRLAKVTGKKTFTLCSVKCFEVNEFKITDVRPENEELPF